MFVSACLLNALACVVSFEIQAAYGEVDAGCVQLGKKCVCVWVYVFVRCTRAFRAFQLCAVR